MVQLPPAQRFPKFVRHGLPWTWLGQRTGSPPEARTILYPRAPTGTRYLHHGQVLRPVAYRPITAMHPMLFALSTEQLKSTAGQYSACTARNPKARHTKVGAIKTIGTELPASDVSSLASGGRRVIRGEIIIDFFAVDYGTCSSRQQVPGQRQLLL